MADKATMAPQASGPPVPKGAWGITVMLLLFMLINFADKFVVGLAGKPITKDLGLTESEFGDLGAAFFYLFSLSAVVVGFVVNKVPARWVLLCLAVIWGLVQFPMIGMVSYSTLWICRVILGAGEGPAFAVAIHALYKWFPDEKRALPTALVAQGSAFGVILAGPGLNWLIVHRDWHWAFGLLGILTLLWAFVWLLVGREGPLRGGPAAGAVEEPSVPYWRLLTSSTFIGCVLATFGAYWALVLGLTWFTKYIVDGLGFTQELAGSLTVLPWIFGAIVVIVSGAISQALITRGVSSRVSRGVLGAAPMVLGGCIILALPLAQSPTAQLAMTILGTGICGSIYVVCPPMISEISPSHQRGAMIAIYGAIYAFAGALAPSVMGRILQRAANPMEGYLTGYMVLGVIILASGILGLLLLRPNADRARLRNLAVAPPLASQPAE